MGSSPVDPANIPQVSELHCSDGVRDLRPTAVGLFGSDACARKSAGNSTSFSSVCRPSASHLRRESVPFLAISLPPSAGSLLLGRLARRQPQRRCPLPIGPGSRKFIGAPVAGVQSCGPRPQLSKILRASRPELGEASGRTVRATGSRGGTASAGAGVHDGQPRRGRTSAQSRSGVDGATSRARQKGHRSPAGVLGRVCGAGSRVCAP
jgi:hypothetical protein